MDAKTLKILEREFPGFFDDDQIFLRAVTQFASMPDGVQVVRLPSGVLLETETGVPYNPEARVAPLKPLDMGVTSVVNDLNQTTSARREESKLSDQAKSAATSEVKAKEGREKTVQDFVSFIKNRDGDAAAAEAEAALKSTPTPGSDQEFDKGYYEIQSQRLADGRMRTRTPADDAESQRLKKELDSMANSPPSSSTVQQEAQSKLQSIFQGFGNALHQGEKAQKKQLLNDAVIDETTPGLPALVSTDDL